MIVTVPSLAGFIAGSILSFGATAYAGRQEARFKAFTDPAFSSFMKTHGTQLEQVSQKISSFWQKGMKNPYAFEREAWAFHCVATAVTATVTIGLTVAVAFVTGPIGWTLSGVIAIWVLTPLVPRLALLALTFTSLETLPRLLRQADSALSYLLPAPLTLRDLVKASLSPPSAWAPYLFATSLAVLGYTASVAYDAFTRTLLYKEQIQPLLDAWLPHASATSDDILQVVRLLRPIFEYEKLSPEERKTHKYLSLEAQNNKAYLLSRGREFCTDSTYNELKKFIER